MMTMDDTQTIDADALRARLAEMAQRARDEMAPAREETAAEVDYLDALLARQHAILTGVANALRGDPGPLASHSHHDLAERAAAAVAEIARLRALLEVAQTSLAAATSGRRVTACDEIERLQRERDALRDATREMLAAIEAPAPVWDADESEHDAHAARLTAAIAALRPLVGDGALDATRADEDHATADDPLLDGTDGAHPAWWRGHDRAAEMLTAQRDAAVARAEAAGGERDALRDAAREYLDARHRGLVALDAYLDVDPADAAARDAASACEARVTAARTRLAALVGDDATMRRDLPADLIDGAYVLRPHSSVSVASCGATAGPCERAETPTG